MVKKSKLPRDNKVINGFQVCVVVTKSAVCPSPDPVKNLPVVESHFLLEMTHGDTRTFPFKRYR